MRNAFLDELLTIADADERVVLLTGDLGFMVLEPFAERHPGRFYNVGVAEQNMVGLATGLAEAGYTPYCYSIATFASLRPYEFLRNGPALHDLPVRIVGVGGGFDYAHNGVTHHALEDLAVMRAQPRMSVLAPADPEQARAALRAGQGIDGPAYFRIGKGGSAVPGLHGRFALGRAELIGSGDDVAIVTAGPIAAVAVEASDLLATHGIGVTIAICASLAPAPDDDLAALLARVPLVVAHEAHYVNGGVGSLVAEVIAERGLGTRLVRCGVREMPSGITGSQRWLEKRHGIDVRSVVAAVTASLTGERTGASV